MLLFRLARRSFLLWLGAFFSCIGLVFLVAGLQDASRENRYQKQGVTVDAVVVGKSIRRAAREGNTSTKYEVAYRFVTEDGRTVEGLDAVGVDEWERLEPGRRFTVTYLPEAPESSRAQGSGGMGSPLVMAIAGTGFALVGGVIVWITGRRVLRHRRLLREGQPGRGTVIAIRPTNVSVNRRRQWELRYQYEDHLGRSHEGTSGSVPPGDLEGFAEGDTVDVRFDRRHPEQSIWVPPTPEPATARAATAQGRRSFWRTLRNGALMLAILFVALVVGESVPALKASERFTARHEPLLLALTIGLTVIGFVTFMGGILLRIFGGAGQPMTHAEIEDLGRRFREREPAVARVSTYRFFGRSAGSSFHDAFTVKDAKVAWRQRAWRSSARWRSNFMVMAGALFSMVGLFGIFVVTGPAGIKLLLGGVLVYAAIRTINAFARA